MPPYGNTQITAESNITFLLYKEYPFIKKIPLFPLYNKTNRIIEV